MVCHPKTCRQSSVEVDVHGSTLHYEVLAVLEFDSDRKRMSIICRCARACEAFVPNDGHTRIEWKQGCPSRGP